ncbi:MAG: MqnA/MqnD/SBP family protein [Clostridiaceae bacterium]|nr:ABC transporter substrate-binding protein [Eubacteriales bacterium]
MWKKLVSLFVLTLMLAAAALGCAAQDTATVRIAALKGPTGMGLVALMGDEYKNEYAITLSGAPDEVSAGFIAGETDVAAVPINLAAALYNKLGGEAVMIAVNTLGVLYVLENGDTVNALTDLSGKTLYATGQGATPEYVLNYLLEKNGLSDVTVEYKTEHSELAALMAAGEITLGMLPEPNVSAAMAQNENLRVALDLTEEWNKVSATPLVQGCLIVRRAFLEEHEGAVKRFLTDYAASTAYVNKNHKKAAALMELYGVVPSEAIAQKAIGNSNIVCLTGDEMKAAAAGMLQVLFDFNAKSVGGAVPGDGLYYGAK